MLRWLASFLILWFVYEVRSVFPPFILGAIFAYLLLPAVHQISTSLKVKRRTAVAFLYLSGLIVISVTSGLFAPRLFHEAASLTEQRVVIVSNIVQKTKSAFHLSLDVDEATQQILKSLEENLGRPQELVHLGGLISHGFLFTLVCVLSSIYFITDSERVGNFSLRFVPSDRRVTVVNLSSEMNRMLSKYVRGQITLVLIMSTVTACWLYFVVHLKYWLLIGILSGFLEIIPVLGPIVATSTATLVGLSQLGLPAVPWIAVFYIFARWFEDYWVVPKIIGHAVDLHPLVIIFAVLCGEVIAGALGMLIAIPVAASIKVIVDFTHPQAAQLPAQSMTPATDPGVP